MKLSLPGYLAAALLLSSGWAAFATYRWATASVRCDARIAEARAHAEAGAREDVRRAQLAAAGIFAAERADLVSALAIASSNSGSRATQILRVPVTGACVMPAGLPSLQPAVEEARRAARD